MDILYADDDLVVVDKPAGMLVHRGWARDDVVAMTAVRDQLERWVYPVHRLDRGASGTLMFALSSRAAAAIGAQLADGRVVKVYLALVRGRPDDAGTIDHAIERREGGPRVEAVTAYRRVESFGRYSLVEARPRTGRLHQIRRHFKHISHPLIGDVRYGKGEHNRLFRDRYGLVRLALHASSLELAHPVTGAVVRVTAPLAADMAGAIEILRTEAAAV